MCVCVCVCGRRTNGYQKHAIIMANHVTDQLMHLVRNLTDQLPINNVTIMCADMYISAYMHLGI